MITSTSARSLPGIDRKTLVNNSIDKALLLDDEIWPLDKGPSEHKVSISINLQTTLC